MSLVRLAAATVGGGGGPGGTRALPMLPTELATLDRRLCSDSAEEKEEGTGREGEGERKRKDNQGHLLVAVAIKQHSEKLQS